MTLNQAIDGYTNNAEFERRNGNLQGCLDFRQLAEWLKDYKRLLEQEPVLDKIRNEIEKMRGKPDGKWQNEGTYLNIDFVLGVIDKCRK